ncbi:uncharacterized protein LOC143274875 [Babylonia areolata]|uniref:uncharacterized protein LOC143274875 n=1 Tax=Babylonia areolata TaxID=304850 RepID=UPI003FD1C50C
MIKLLLCFSCVILFSAGSPTQRGMDVEAEEEGVEGGGALQCPFLPCPLPPCDDPTPTYYNYHGKQCQGCSQCPLSKEVTCPFLPCPYLPCAANDTYSTYYPYHGQLCQGCSQCLPGTLQTHGDPATRQLSGFRCPVMECAIPGCPVEVVSTTISFHGHSCPGCPVCPSTGMAGPSV